MCTNLNDVGAPLDSVKLNVGGTVGSKVGVGAPGGALKLNPLDVEDCCGGAED